MGEVIRVPNAAISAVPAVECELPTGWAAIESPGVLASLGPVDDPSITVLVSSVRVERDLGLRGVAVRSFAQQRRSHPQARIDTQRVGRFDGRLTYLRSVTLPGPEPVAQLHALFFAPSTADREVADVFSVVGSCPEPVVAGTGPIFVDIVASFRFVAEQD